MASSRTADRAGLRLRVASAVIGVPVILFLIYIGGMWYVAAVAVALAVAAAEMQHAWRQSWLDPVGVLVALLVAGIVVAAHMQRDEWWAWLLGALVLAPAAALVSPSGRGYAGDAAWALGGVVYAGVLGGCLVLLRDAAPDGRGLAYLTVLSTFAVDTAAYFTGRSIGRHKLAPRISPNKTVEGFAGGYVAGFVAVIVLSLIFDVDLELWQAAVIGVLLPPAAAAGDLVESAMKRATQIKDASELIPGHGGVLDRLDSLLFTFATVYVLVELFGA